MTILVNQDFIRGTGQSQSRTLVICGLVAIVALALSITLTTVIYPRATAPTGLHLTLESPLVGPGVKPGTKVVLHGSDIGQVTSVDPTDVGNTIKLGLVLDRNLISGLTRNFNIVFSPKNYFGITAVEIVPGRGGGGNLLDGSVIALPTATDASMSSMLERGSIVIDGTLTTQMVSTLQKAISYTDGILPLIHSGVMLAQTVSDTQQQFPTILLQRMNDVSDAMPGFSEAFISALMSIYNNVYNHQSDGFPGVDKKFMDKTNEALLLAGGDFFGQAGTLLKSHGTELTPAVTDIKVLTDVLPGVVGGENVGTIGVIANRMSHVFDPKNHALRVDIDASLMTLPGIAAGSPQSLGR